MPGTYTIPFRPGLGRHVHHDWQSRRFPYVRGAAEPFRPPNVLHARHIPIFDQGNPGLGKCTACTGLGLLGTGPYWDALRIAQNTPTPTAAGRFPFTDEGTTALYTDITLNDPFEGTWPPMDTGSDGLSMAKALVRAGIIPGYQHTFSLNEALRALADYPLAIGSLWTDRMFLPDRRGLIRYLGNVEGGHEWIADQYVRDVQYGTTVTDWVGGTTSWGTSFGRNGRFYLTVDDFARLLADDGDVIVLTPPTAPAPTPLPVPVVEVPPALDPAGTTLADRALADAMRVWLQAKGL